MLFLSKAFLHYRFRYCIALYDGFSTQNLYCQCQQQLRYRPPNALARCRYIFFYFHLVLLQAYYSNDFFSGMFCHFLTGNVLFDQRALLDQQLMYSSDMDLDPPDPHYGRSPGAGFRWQKSPNTGIDQKSSENLMLIFNYKI